KGKERGAKREHKKVLAPKSANRKFKIENPKWCHLMTLSALASTFGGIVKPICLAVLRLTTNSNFIGCSTGISAGLAPLRILSILIAARLITSPELGP